MANRFLEPYGKSSVSSSAYSSSYAAPQTQAAATYNYGVQTFGAFPVPGAAPLPSPLDIEISHVLQEINAEISTLEQESHLGERFKNARRLLIAEKNRLENNVDPEWLEVDIAKPIKLTKKVIIPTFRHPKFNFAGKVIGPKGATLQNIAKTHKCHIFVLGRGTTKDRAKEVELLASGDPQHAHLNGPAHVQIDTTGPPPVAYQRVSGVLQVLSELLQPVKDTNLVEQTNATTGSASAIPGNEAAQVSGEAVSSGSNQYNGYERGGGTGTDFNAARNQGQATFTAASSQGGHGFGSNRGTAGNSGSFQQQRGGGAGGILRGGMPKRNGRGGLDVPNRYLPY